VKGLIECRPIGRGVSTRRFESERMSHRQLDVDCRIPWRVARDMFESGQNARNRIDIQRVESGTAFGARVKRRKQRRERNGLFLEVDALNRSDELIALTLDILHVRRSVRLYPERLADIRHRTLQAVVRNGDIRPRGLDQRLLRDEMTGMGDQNVKNSKVAADERHRIGAAKQSLTG